MTAAIVTLVVLNLVALAICADSRRRDQAHARAIHPSNWVEVGDDLDDHWADVVAVFDDGKALVREAEDWLRGLA